MGNMESLTIKYINHKDITDEFLNKIVLIKGQHWEYSIKDQLKWISQNINSNDKHLMIFNKEDTLIAYMNMVNVKIDIENINYDALGIGNVCVDNNNIRKNMGKLLMSACDSYLSDVNKTGVLLCKGKLNAFYIKAGWIEYKNKLIIKKKIFNNNVFFSDNRFINSTEIIIDRDF